MAATCSANLELYLRSSQSDGTNFPGVSVALPVQSSTLSYPSGTAAGSINGLHLSRYTAGASLSLTNGLSNVFGRSVTFAHLHLLRVANTGTVAATVSGNFVAAIFGGTNPLSLDPGEIIVRGTGSTNSAGYVVTAGSRDTITLGIGTGGNIDITLGGRNV